MKRRSYPWNNNGKNRELMVYDTIVRGKRLITKVNVDWINMPKMYWKWQNHPIGATTLYNGEKPVSKQKEIWY